MELSQKKADSTIGTGLWQRKEGYEDLFTAVIFPAIDRRVF